VLNLRPSPFAHPFTKKRLHALWSPHEFLESFINAPQSSPYTALFTTEHTSLHSAKSLGGFHQLTSTHNLRRRPFVVKVVVDVFLSELFFATLTYRVPPLVDLVEQQIIQ